MVMVEPVEVMAIEMADQPWLHLTQQLWRWRLSRLVGDGPVSRSGGVGDATTAMPDGSIARFEAVDVMATMKSGIGDV